MLRTANSKTVFPFRPADLVRARRMVAIIATLAGLAATAHASVGDSLFSNRVQPGPLGKLGDFDGDGRLDRMSWSLSSVTFYRGLGNGDFEAPVTAFTEPAQTSQFVADVNGDGRDDLLSWKSGTPVDSLTIQFGAATGIGGTATYSLAPASTQFLLADDFTGDGKVDLAQGSAAGSNQLVFLHVGDNSGSFVARPAQIIGTGPFLFSKHTGDFDGDGDLDIAAGADGPVILENDGLGHFTKVSVTNAGGAALSFPLAIGQFDGDAAIEILVSLTSPLNALAIVDSLGVGNGYVNLATILQSDVAANTTSAKFSGTGDFDSDGRDDLAFAATIGIQPHLAILRAAATPSGMTPFSHRPIATNSSLTVANVDADAAPEILDESQFNSVLVMLDPIQSDPSVVYPGIPSSNFDGLAVGDFDLDSDIDLVNERSGAGNGLLRNDGSGNFGPHEPLPTQASFVFTVDAATTPGPDLLVAGESGNFVLLRNDGAGHFTPAPQTAAVVLGWPFVIATGDVNGDGHPDAVFSANTGVGVALGTANGITAHSQFSTFELFVKGVALGDVTGDGLLDVVTAESTFATVPGSCAVYAGDGVGGFTYAFRGVCGKEPSRVAVADFDRDGRDDAAVVSWGTDVVDVLLSNGANFEAPQTIATSLPIGISSRIVAAELTGDAWTDLIVFDESARVAMLLFGNSAGTFTPSTAHRIVAGALAVADLDADGRADLIAESSTSAQTTIAFARSQAVGSAIYGVGKPGALGIPTLLSLASPSLGQPTGLRIEKGLPGALPVMFLSTNPANIPFDQGALLVALPAFVIPLSPFSPSTTLDLPFVLPTDTALCGLSIHFQSIHVDPAAIGALSTAQSQGLRWTLGM